MFLNKLKLPKQTKFGLGLAGAITDSSKTTPPRRDSALCWFCQRLVKEITFSGVRTTLVNTVEPYTVKHSTL